MQTSVTSSNILIELPFPCENHQHSLIILGHYSALLSSHHNSMQLCLQHSESFLENFLNLSKVLLQSISKFLCTTLSGTVTEMTSLIDNNYSFKFFSFFFFVTVKNTLIKLFKRRKEFIWLTISEILVSGQLVPKLLIFSKAETSGYKRKTEGCCTPQLGRVVNDRIIGKM